MRCALVEFTLSHGHTLATFVDLLHKLGIGVDAYLRTDVARHDPFLLCPGLEPSIHLLEAVTTRSRLKLRNFGDYDFVLVNSVEPGSVLTRLASVRVPVLGVVHNAVVLAEDPDYRAFFSDSRRRPIVLARHVADYLGGESRIGWIAPVVYGVQAATRAAVSWNRLFVDGRIDFRRRNYWALLDAVEELAHSVTEKFEVDLTGGARDLDGTRLRREVRDRGLSMYFLTEPEPFHFRSYLSRMSSAGYVLPLVDTSSPLFRPYFEDKISSSVPLAIGIGAVPVLHVRLAELYGLEAAAITYRDGQLAGAIREALAWSGDTRIGATRELAAQRDALLAASLDNLARALVDLGCALPG
jgi:hypothetical protein